MSKRTVDDIAARSDHRLGEHATEHAADLLVVRLGVGALAPLRQCVAGPLVAAILDTGD